MKFGEEGKKKRKILLNLIENNIDNKLGVVI